MNVFNVISLFGGLALFLYGMRIMGDGLRQSSSKTFKKAVGKATSNPISSFLIGLFLTAIIQSSTATIVITSGLVGAGLLTLHQSLGIILGANVGTTVTGQIIRLMDINASETSLLNFLKPSTLAPIAAIIGILMVMAFKFKGADKIGEIAMGFGILFTGLMNMTAAVEPLSQAPWFTQLFLGFTDKPFLGFLAGTAVAFILQSSSASVGILQALSITGQLSMSSVYAIIIGIYMGDCITTAIVCSIGAKPDAKRTGIVHILFNICQVILVTLAMTILHSAGVLDSMWSVPITSGGIADLNTIFKLGCAVILLPFCGLFEKLSRIVVKDEAPDSGNKYAESEILDKAFYRTPSIAFTSSSTSIMSIIKAAYDNYRAAMNQFYSFDDNAEKEINEKEEFIDYMTDKVSKYLVGLAPLVDNHGNEIVNFNMRCADEIERIGDHSVNLLEKAAELHDQGMEFSESAKAELGVINEAIETILGYAEKAFASRDIVSAKHIEPLEEVVDELCEDLRNRHVDRLKNGQCNAEVGSVFLDVLMNIERISDQCSNIGVHTISLYDPTVLDAQHEYLNSLHKGADQKFNEEYNEALKKYTGMLAVIESKA